VVRVTVLAKFLPGGAEGNVWKEIRKSPKRAWERWMGETLPKQAAEGIGDAWNWRSVPGTEVSWVARVDADVLQRVVGKSGAPFFIEPLQWPTRVSVDYVARKEGEDGGAYAKRVAGMAGA
jgi:hypothetical protein